MWLEREATNIKSAQVSEEADAADMEWLELAKLAGDL